MKNLVLFLTISVCLFLAFCKKDSQSEKFKLLTGPVWASDSLLADHVDASGPTGRLKDFKGDVIFRPDGTGNFGKFTGTWKFVYNETELLITSDSLAYPLTTKIVELTANSLKVTTSIPNILPPPPSINIRMTFKAK
jgi:hypothetical protein